MWKVKPRDLSSLIKAKLVEHKRKRQKHSLQRSGDLLLGPKKKKEKSRYARDSSPRMCIHRGIIIGKCFYYTFLYLQFKNFFFYYYNLSLSEKRNITLFCFFFKFFCTF